MSFLLVLVRLAFTSCQLFFSERFSVEVAGPSLGYGNKMEIAPMEGAAKR